MRVGDRSLQVAAWQRELARGDKPTTWTNDDGVTRSWPASWEWPLAADGIFGQKTQWATEAWQFARGRIATGIVSDADLPSDGERVEVNRTIVDLESFAAAAVAAWPHVFGSTPSSKAAVAVVYAQYIIETGGRECWNFNIGNVKKAPGDGYNWMPLKGVWEMIGGKRVELGPGDPGARFRAYDSLAHGMRDHLAFLSRGRYASAWPATLAGDVRAFASELHRKGYFTADPSSYARGMLGPFNAFMRSDAFEHAMSAPLDTSSFVPVECDGVTWLVAPIYIAPIGIGQAVDLAAHLGCDLPTPELVDAIWRAADLKIDASKMTRPERGPEMNAPDTHADQAQRLAGLVGDRALGVDYKLIAGAFKDIVVHDHIVGLYGWHRADGTVIQPFYSLHDAHHRDYSQGLRLVRRAT